MTFNERLKEMQQENENPERNAAIVRALERKPEFQIPDNFAARVAGSVPASIPAGESAVARCYPHFGVAAGYLVAAMAVVVLLVLTRLHPEALEAGRGFLFAMEVVLLVQLLAIGFWLGTRRPV